MATTFASVAVNSSSKSTRVEGYSANRAARVAWPGPVRSATDAGRPAIAVLVVDRAVHERDHSAETRGEPLRLEVIAEKLKQLSRAQCPELVDAHLVGAHDPAFRESLQQPHGAQFFVADHVCGDVFDGPPGTKAGRVPLLRCQGGQEIGEVGPFGAGHSHQVAFGAGFARDLRHGAQSPYWRSRSAQLRGTRPRGPGTVWSWGWHSGGASSGPS
jgi:hypothetical protein